MRIGLLTQWFDPEPGPASLPGELARELVRRGHDVQVVTGFPNYPTGEIYQGYEQRRKTDEIVAGVKIRRVPLYPSHDASALRRVVNYSSFGLSAAINGIDCLADRDAVWVSNSPPTVALAMARLKRLNVPVVLHVLDLWPDNVVTAQLGGSRQVSDAMAKGIHAWNRWMYGAADRILTISPGVIDILQSRGVPQHKLGYAPLWANETIFHPTGSNNKRQELGVPDDIVVAMYAGAIGETQGLDVLVDALERVPHDIAQQMEFWVLGSGIWEPELRLALARLSDSAPRVRLLGRVPMSEMASWSQAADITYVGLKTDAHSHHTMPSKVQTSLAMGRPILTSVPGDVDRLVRSQQVGFSSGGAGAVELADALASAVRTGREGLSHIGHHAREVYLSEFSLRAGASTVEKNLVAVSSGKSVGRQSTQAGRSARLEASVEPLELRQATMDDIDTIVQLHLASFPGFFLSFLGPRFLTVFYEELCNDPGAVLIVAHRGGQLVGFVGGVVDEGHFFRSLRERRQKDFIRAASWAAFRRPSVVPRLWRARHRDEQEGVFGVPATLLTIGVAPRVQGAGAGKALLDAFSDVLARQGVDSYKLTTDADNNDTAVGFYERNGLINKRTFVTAEGRKMLEFVWIGKCEA